MKLTRKFKNQFELVRDVVKRNVHEKISKALEERLKFLNLIKFRIEHKNERPDKVT